MSRGLPLIEWSMHEAGKNLIRLAPLEKNLDSPTYF